MTDDSLKEKTVLVAAPRRTGGIDRACVERTSIIATHYNSAPQKRPLSSLPAQLRKNTALRYISTNAIELEPMDNCFFMVRKLRMQ